MNMSNKIWFFDIDDTLIDTAGTSHLASEGIRKVFTDYFDLKIANKVTRSFNDIFNLLLAGYRVKQREDWKNVQGGKNAFDTLLNQIESYQINIKKDYGAIKKWSRETLIKIAADMNNLSITPEVVHEGANSYWVTLTNKTIVFSGAKKLFNYLNKKDQPIFLMTSSDARLKMQKNGQFIYDPAYSEKLKRERIELLRRKNLEFRLVSIGDPEDKPSIKFFQKAVSMAEASLGYSLNLNDCIAVGDSYAGDLETPHKRMGFGLVVLFAKGQTNLKNEEDGFISTGDLFELVNL